MSVTGTPQDEADYSDFQYQQARMFLRPGESTTGPTATIRATAALEPLESIGGLANNEVAELVAHRITVALRANDQAASGDQNVGAGVYVSGAFGANADDDDLIPSQMQEAGSTDVIDNTTTNAAATPVFLSAVAQGRVFEMFQADGGIAFDDDTSGLGGSESWEAQMFERNWRQTTGRGPILDQTDDVTWAAAVDAFDNVIQNLEVSIQTHLIWDVAELSDAGRVFSVPRS